MIVRDSKTIVFYGEKFPQYKYIKDHFSFHPFLKVFQTKNVDELTQILNQSKLTAILVRNVFHIQELAKNKLLGLKEAGVRIYFLDTNVLNKEQIEKLSIQRVSTLISISDENLKIKLEMFMMSKITLKNHVVEKEEETEEAEGSKPAYFSYFKKIENEWVLHASTHEKEKEIETIFDKSWTLYAMDLLQEADKITKIQEDQKFSKNYYSIIYPHRFPDGSKGLSIVHIKKDKSFAETYMRSIEFLAKI